MSAPKTAALTLSGISICDPAGKTLLENARLEVGAGETILLVGPSGCGKSTLLRVLAGLLGNGSLGWKITGHLDTGTETIDLSSDQFAAGALVFQHHALFDDLTVAENLRIAATHANQPTEHASAVARALTGGLPHDQQVYDCSGGQRQLVAIARTVLAEPGLLLLDEPNSGLDAGRNVRLAQSLDLVKRQTDKPLLITAHHVRYLLPVADRVVFLDPAAKALVPLEPHAEIIEKRIRSAGAEMSTKTQPPAPAPEETDKVGASSPPSRSFWQARYLGRYLWQLCFAPEALLYMLIGGVLVGFVTTWFTFRHVPLDNYLTPLFHQDLLAGIGFAQFRVLVPLIAAMLLASRSSAIIAADLGHRVYSQQLDAMRSLKVPHERYLTANILLATLIAAFVSLAAMLAVSAWVSLETWRHLFPDAPGQSWKQGFFTSVLPTPGSAVPDGWGWVTAKTALSAAVTGVIAIAFGRARKTSVIDLNTGIAYAIIATLSAVLLIHTAFAFAEF